MSDLAATNRRSDGHDQMAEHGRLEIALTQLEGELAAIDRTAATCPWICRTRLRDQKWRVEERIARTRAELRRALKS